MDYQLVVVRGRSNAQVLELVDGVTTVGRHDDCQLRIKSSQVSRKHCELFEKQGLLLVKDLASANGTFVNGQKVDGQRVLEPGDELMIGQVRLRVEKKAGAAAVAAPAAKPNDTAVVAAAASAEAPASAPDDDFELEFDDMGATPAVVSVGADAAGADFEIDDLLNESPPAPASTPAPPTPAPAAKPEPPDAPAKEMGDDAVADFLLDIKFDEDDR